MIALGPAVLAGVRGTGYIAAVTDPLQHVRAAFAGQYKVERELGAGGMATVYLAHDVKHDRQVAIKILRPELAAAPGPDRFPREIKIVARLQHPAGGPRWVMT